MGRGQTTVHHGWKTAGPLVQVLRARHLRPNELVTNAMNSSLQFRGTGFRHRLSRDADVRAIIQREGKDEPIDALLVDVSSNGIQLRVSVGLKFEESVAVHIVAKEMEFDVAGVVRWLRPADKESWYVGCRIQPAFSEEALSHLASMGCIERRGSAREAIRLTATVCGELEHNQQAAIVHNLSADGLGLATPEPRTVGQQIIVHVPALDGATISFPARVQWQLQAPDGYICGCSSTDREFYGRLCELIEVKSMASGFRDPPGLNWSPRHSLWVALAVLILFIFPTLLVITVEADPSAANAAKETHSVRRNEMGDAAVSAADADGTPAVDEAPLGAVAELPDMGANAGPLVDHAASANAAGDRSMEDNDRPLTTATGAINPDDDLRSADDPPSDYRTWVDDTGRHRVVARLVAVEGDSVQLQKENGHTATVPLSRLSPDDNEYVRRWVDDAQ